MAVLLNEYKRLQYIIDSLVLPFLKSQHPKWRELILTYLKFLDENATFKAKNITDNVNVNDMYTELLDDFLNLYFKDVVDLNKFGLNDDNKRLFIALSKLIGNLKSTKTSFGFFFNSFTDFSIPTAGGDINVNDLVIELDENSDWWLENNDPTRPFTYVFRINETELTNLKELIREVHPAGFLQLFLYEVAFEDNMDGTDCLELSIHYGALYNAKWNYDAIMEVEGAPAPLLYNGGYTINETHCNDLPIASAPVITHDLTSGTISGYDQFYELAGSDQWENPTDGDEWFDLDFGPDPREFTFTAPIGFSITSDIELPVIPLTWTLKKDLSLETPGQTIIYALYYNPLDDSILAGMSNDGQIWKSDDAGDTWALIEDFSDIGPYNSQTVNQIVHDTNSDVLIASASQGGTIWRSTDDGDNWTFVQALGAEIPSQNFIYSSCFDTSRNRIILGTGNEAQIWTSDNAGLNWTLRKDFSLEVPTQSQVHGMIYDPFHDTVVAGTSGGGQIWTSGDGGVTWTKRKDPIASGEVSIFAFAYNPTSHRIVAGTSRHAQIWVSDDGGLTWTFKKDLAAEVPSQLWIFGAEYAADRSTFYLGTIPDGQVWASDDNGETWVLEEELTDDQVRSLTFDSVSGRLFAGTGFDAQIWAGAE